MNLLKIDNKYANISWAYFMSGNIMKAIEKRIDDVLKVDVNDKSGNDAKKALEEIKNFGLEMRDLENVGFVDDDFTMHDSFFKPLALAIGKNEKIYSLPVMGKITSQKNHYIESTSSLENINKIRKIINRAPLLSVHFKNLMQFTEDCGISNGLHMDYSQNAIGNILNFKNILDKKNGEIIKYSRKQMCGNCDSYVLFCSHVANGFVEKYEATGYLGRKGIGPLSRAMVFESEEEIREHVKLGLGALHLINYMQIVKIKMSVESVVSEPIIKKDEPYLIDGLKSVISDNDKKALESEINTNTRKIKKKKL